MFLGYRVKRWSKTLRAERTSEIRKFNCTLLEMRKPKLEKMMMFLKRLVQGIVSTSFLALELLTS